VVDRAVCRRINGFVNVYTAPSLFLLSAYQINYATTLAPLTPNDVTLTRTKKYNIRIEMI